MFFQYSVETWFILIAMVGTGAARTLAVKLLYQTGFEAPLYVTLLYLLGQALSLIVYSVQRCRQGKAEPKVPEKEEEEEKKKKDFPEDNPCAQLLVGSAHGLNHESKDSITWTHKIPFLLKPLIPGICNMFNSLFGWASLVYIAASVGEMLISGVQLALSVLAARIIRKRMVSSRRWQGVAVVVSGITLIGLADVLLGDKNEASQSDAPVVGILLIIGQSILSVLQDLAEEIFMQTGEFPPTLLLGMEGLFGFIISLILFFAFGSTFHKGPSETWEEIEDDKSFLVGYSIGLTLLFTTTGIFNIKATQVTSAMTRNIWKNLRAVLVWVTSLLIFYLGGNASLGEEFVVPESLVILLGFAIMTVGIFVYYSQKAKEEEEAKEKGDPTDLEDGDDEEADYVITGRDFDT